jgi:hypothetical protein
LLNQPVGTFSLFTELTARNSEYVSILLERPVDGKHGATFECRFDYEDAMEQAAENSVSPGKVQR